MSSNEGSLYSVGSSMLQLYFTCSGRLQLHCDTGTAVGGTSFPSAIGVYPNPVGDVLTLGGMSMDATYHIADLAGRTILTGVIKQGGQIDTHTLYDGLYVLLLYDHSRVVARKFTKL